MQKKLLSIYIKYIKYLEEKNNVTEEDFGKWMNKTGDRVIKEMNKAD